MCTKCNTISVQYWYSVTRKVTMRQKVHCNRTSVQNVYVHERQWMPSQVYGPEWYGPDHTRVWAGVVLAGQYQVMGRSGIGRAGVVLAGPEWYWCMHALPPACTHSPALPPYIRRVAVGAERYVRCTLT